MSPNRSQRPGDGEEKDRADRKFQWQLEFGVASEWPVPSHDTIVRRSEASPPNDIEQNLLEQRAKAKNGEDALIGATYAATMSGTLREYFRLPSNRTFTANPPSPASRDRRSHRVRRSRNRISRAPA